MGEGFVPTSKRRRQDKATRNNSAEGSKGAEFGCEGKKEVSGPNIIEALRGKKTEKTKILAEGGGEKPSASPRRMGVVRAATVPKGRKKTLGWTKRSD